MNENPAVRPDISESLVIEAGAKPWIIAVTALLANSVLRGLRAPNSWSCTHLLLNYDFGVAKRALQGAILSALDVPNLYSYDFCFSYSATFLAVNIGLLCGLLWYLCTLRDANSRLMACVYASSVAAVMLAHSIGYADHIGLFVTLLILLIKNFYARALVAAVSFSAVMLIHDGPLAMFFPLIMFRFLGDLRTPIQQGRVAALSLMCVCVLTVFAWTTTLGMSEASAAALCESLQARAEYLLQPFYFTFLTYAYGDHAKLVQWAWSLPGFPYRVAICLVVTLPTIAYLVHGTMAMLAHHGQSRVIQGSAMIAGLAPLSLFAIANDVERYATLAITTSFLVFAVSALSFHARAGSLPSVTRSRIFAAIALIVVNAGAWLSLYDAYVVDNFPYRRLTHNVIDIISGKAPFPPEPERPSTTRDCKNFSAQ